MSKGILSPWHVVLLRPYSQSAPLAHTLSEQGAKITLFPTLNIVPVDVPDLVPYWHTHMDEVKGCIFLSANAVDHLPPFALERLKRGQQLSTGPQVIAMGPGTGRALQQKGIYQQVIAPAGSTSESVADFILRESPNSKGPYWIVAGQGGRDHLLKVFQDKHVVCRKFPVYRRQAVLEPRVPVEQLALLDPHTVVVATSGDILEHFLTLCQPYVPLKEILGVKLIVMSERLSDIARSKGFAHIWRASSLESDALIGVLTCLKE